jgi:hypothetical protein
MSTVIGPGVRVRITDQRFGLCNGFGRHGMVDATGHVGIVDRVDERLGDHPVVVEFRTLRCPILGTTWVDSFKPSELMVVDDQA